MASEIAQALFTNNPELIFRTKLTLSRSVNEAYLRLGEQHNARFQRQVLAPGSPTCPLWTQQDRVLRSKTEFICRANRYHDWCDSSIDGRSN